MNWKRTYFWLKIILVVAVFIALCVLVGKAQATEPTAAWDPSPGATGYIVYYTDGATEYHAVATETHMALTLFGHGPVQGVPDHGVGFQ